MALFAAFCGGSNTERSTAIDDELTLNLFPCTVEAGESPKRKYLQGTPGQRYLGSVSPASGIGGCRGIFTQDGRTWAVVGNEVFALTIDRTVPATPTVTGVSLGIILDDGFPVSFASNGDGGSHLAIVGGGELKIVTLFNNVLSAAIALPLSNAPVSIGFLDGYFLLLEDHSLRIWFSALENGALWDALDFFARSTASDHWVGMAVANNRVYGFGSETSEAYEDTGDADNPWQPIRGSLFQIGLAARWSLSIETSTVHWLGQSSRGGACVYKLDGFGGQRVSTHAIERQLASYPTLTDCEGLTYEQDGHTHFCLTCPSGDVAGVTHVFDETEQAWHQRSHWNTALARDELWRVRGHVWVQGLHLVGSRDRLVQPFGSGERFWMLDLDTYTDDLPTEFDPHLVRGVRRAPYLGAENSWAFVDAFELGVETGVGLNTGQGIDPQVELRVSKDLGKTWVSAGNASLGPMGGYDDRTLWRRLGRARLDRLVFEVVITDPVKRILGPGAWLKVRPGSGAAA